MHVSSSSSVDSPEGPIQHEDRSAEQADPSVIYSGLVIS